MHAINSMERRIQALDPRLAKLDNLAAIEVEVSEVLMYTDTLGVAAHPQAKAHHKADEYCPAMHEGKPPPESPATPPVGATCSMYWAPGKAHSQGASMQREQVAELKPHGPESMARPIVQYQTKRQVLSQRRPDARNRSILHQKTQRASSVGAKKSSCSAREAAAHECTGVDDRELQLTNQNCKSVGRHSNASQQCHLVGRRCHARLPERPNLRRPGVIQSLKLDLS
jgi:hypothetical protein